jgi:hypothetical protein
MRRLYVADNWSDENWDIRTFARFPLSEIVLIRLGFRKYPAFRFTEEESRKHQAQLTAEQIPVSASGR